MSDWPDLDSARDHETFALLHLTSQMLGKIRVRHAPWVNHGWHATLRPTSSGLTTLPTAAGDGRTFTLALDLCRHGVALNVSDGSSVLIAFDGKSVAALHSELLAGLEQNGLPAGFHGKPNEIAEAVPFASDDQPRAYASGSATRLHQALQAMVPVFDRFRAAFTGKTSPLQFFWGSFDLALTRFSGRAAPEHPGGIPGLPDRITREAYSHEVSSAGFWAGGAVEAAPFFYSYAYPEPAGFREVKLPAGGWNPDFQEFTLSYHEVRRSGDPDALLTSFLQSSYQAAANRAKWDRRALEREPVAP